MKDTDNLDDKETSSFKRSRNASESIASNVNLSQADYELELGHIFVKIDEGLLREMIQLLADKGQLYSIFYSYRNNFNI